MSLATDIHSRICEVANDGVHGLDRAELVPEIRRLVCEVAPLTPSGEIAEVVDEVMAHVDGLGPLHHLALESGVSEIMVNGDGSVFVEANGELRRTEHVLGQDETLHLARRLASRAGRRIDAARPAVDVRLDDGSRLHAVIPPLAVDGPHLTIRRFTDKSITLAELADPQAASLLEAAVVDRATVIVAGATSSGKTTLLNVLGAAISNRERVITIEDAAELRLPGEHIVRLETRPAAEGLAAVGVRELVRHALRMRPDRIICGEMRGAEAFDLVQAMNTGHAGSLSTLHANGASDAMRRIETMMLLADAELPLPAIREQLATCVDLVVFMARGDNGARRVQTIHEVPDRPTPGWDLIERFVS